MAQSKPTILKGHSQLSHNQNLAFRSLPKPMAIVKREDNADSDCGSINDLQNTLLGTLMFPKVGDLFYEFGLFTPRCNAFVCPTSSGRNQTRCDRG